MTSPRRAARLFVMLVALVGVYRLTLLGRGATAFVDETGYFKSVMVLQALAARDGRGALGHVANNFARPGWTLLEVPVAALQSVPFAFGVAASNPRSLLIPTVVNVALSIAILYLVFQIAAVLCGDLAAALATTVMYALLVNTNLYVRHVLPYDWALAVGVFALWLALTREPTAATAAITGALAALLITIYPGYYLLAPAIGVAVVGPSLSGPRQAVRRALVFTVTFAAVIVATELLCRAGGFSYIGSARALSRTITHGSFEEGWRFLPQYLVRVERLSGVVLLAAGVVGVCRAVLHALRRSLRPIDWLVLAAAGGWIWQAVAAAELHRMVLYGRTIHPWMMFMAWALADAIASMSRARLRDVACASVVLVAIISWIPSARTYYRLAYPPDVLYALGIDTARLPTNRMVCELTEGTSYASPAPLDRVTRRPYTTGTNVLLINFCQGSPSMRLKPGAERGELLYDGPHFLSFLAYGYEDIAPPAREDMARMGYRVRAYRLPR